MKDLEKIKSEDLGCQVQDANPGNFAIEQEVAQLVGATVPAPTEPSADDARELGAQLLVFLRRALLPIRSALRTALAAIYAHLDSRCTDYTPAAYAPYKPLPSYDPMGTPPTPRSVANLLTALTAFSARKISNGGDTPDGISLLHLLSDSSLNITEYYDNNEGWNMDIKLPVFSSALVATINCKSTNVSIGSCFPNAEVINLPSLEYVGNNPVLIDFHSSPLRQLLLPSLRSCGTLICGSWYWNGTIPNLTELNLPALTEIRKTNNYQYMAFIGSQCPNLQTISMPNLERLEWYLTGGFCLEGLRKLYLPKLVYLASSASIWDGGLVTPTNKPSGNFLKSLIHFEIGEVASNLNLKDWSAEYALDASRTDLIEQGSTAENNLDQFLQNFREHIALRLAQQPADNPNHLTLTLSQAVFDTIWNQDGTPKSTDPDSVIYQINKIIKTDKHWSVNRA